MTFVASAATGAGDSTRRPGENQGFRPDIQGLRAIAVAMVVIYHLYPSLLPGGFAGVDVFFVISGFLITGHLWRGYAQTGKVGLPTSGGGGPGGWCPAAALVLTVTWSRRACAARDPAADTAQQIRASALYYQNWQLASDAVNYLKSDDAATPVQHFWSLSVEEQFYLVWPLLFLLAALLAACSRAPAAGRPTEAGGAAHHGRAASRRRADGGAGHRSLAYSIYYTHANPPGAYFMTTTRIWELGAGGLLALLPRG